MLSRAFTKPRRNSNVDVENSCRSIDEYGDCVIGFMEDMPLNFCGGVGVGVGGGGGGECGGGSRSYLTLRGVLKASVGVIGESRLGMTEKVVLWVGKVCTVKRFTKVTVGRGEFGRRIQLLAQVSRRYSEYLVPVNAFLYSKRIKFVVSDYHPMGSLADLLAGARELGHTALDWNHRLIIVLHIARAIAFIHSQSPPNDRNLQMNVHGNIKSSNVMINIDFSACLSDYGFAQLAQRMEVLDTWQGKPPPPLEVTYCDKLCQKSDVYNFGVIVLDTLGGPQALSQEKCIAEKKEEIKNGDIEFFEFPVEGKARKQASLVLDIALACTNRLPEARPAIEQVLLYLGDVLSGKGK